MEPDELRYKEFKRSVRGYSPDEVDDLLDTVAEELDEARTEQTRLTAELNEARSRIEQYQSLEGSIRDTLSQAEKAAGDYQEAARRDAESTVEAARREAEVVIHDAEASARRMLASASAKVDRVQRSYEALQETRTSLGADLRRLLEGYLQTLDEANSTTGREIEAPLRDRLDDEAISAAHEASDRELLEKGQKSQQNGREESQPESHQEGEDTGHGDTREEDQGVDEAADAHGAGEETAETTETGDGAEESSGKDDPEDETVASNEESGESRRGRFLRRRG